MRREGICVWLATLTALSLWAGHALGARAGLAFALVLAGLTNLGANLAMRSSLPMQSGPPASAHLFIQNPFGGGGLLRLFSTHPPTTARVERLEAMAVRGSAVAV